MRVCTLYAGASLLLFMQVCPVFQSASYALSSPVVAAGWTQHEDSGESYRKVFADVERGIADGIVQTFSGHFGSQLSVSLRGGESGYYSANQAYYLLENYLRTRKLTGFTFSTIGESDSNPYATGSVRISSRGTRENAQVYVSLSFAGRRWVITQMNIY